MIFNYFQKKKNNIKKENLYNPKTSVWSDDQYKNLIRNGYYNNPIVFRCINIISYTISTIPVIFYEYEKDKKYTVKKSKLERLLKRPNPMHTRQEFFEKIVSYILLSGNAFILKVKKNIISELYVLNPEKIKILEGENQIPLQYIYNNGEKNMYFDVNQITGDSNILHIKNFDPSFNHYGLSSTKVVSKNIDQYNKSSEWNQSLLNNYAKPSGALYLKNNKDGNGNLTEEQYLRLKSQIEENMGVKNSGKPLLLEGGLEWKEMSISPKDMDFLENKISNSRDIATAFGVPTQLLGIPGENKYNNLLEARTYFWEYTILPLAEKIKDKINNWLSDDSKGSVYFDFDKENIDIFIQKRKMISDYLEKISFMSINEKRVSFGLNTVKDEKSIKNN